MVSTIKIRRVELRVGSTGVYTANSYNISYKNGGRTRIARPNPRFDVLRSRGGRIIAKCDKKVDEVRP